MFFEPEERFVPWNELRRRDPRSRSTIWRHMRAGSFPLSYEIGGKIAWLAKELNAHYEKLQRSRLKPLMQDEVAKARSLAPRKVPDAGKARRANSEADAP